MFHIQSLKLSLRNNRSYVQVFTTKSQNSHQNALKVKKVLSFLVYHIWTNIYRRIYLFWSSTIWVETFLHLEGMISNETQTPNRLLLCCKESQVMGLVDSAHIVLLTEGILFILVVLLGVCCDIYIIFKRRRRPHQDFLVHPSPSDPQIAIPLPLPNDHIVITPMLSHNHDQPH